LRLKSATGEYFTDLDAAVEVDGHHLDEATVVFFTPKSNQTEDGVTRLAAVAPPETLVIGFQNGVTNEERLSAHFASVYGGVCRMTCSFLQPGQVSYRRQGRVVVGKYPKGADPLAKKLSKILEDAGFDAASSNNISSDKWLKLVVNLQSGFHAIIDNRDHDTMEFIGLKLGVLEEAQKVLKASKIRARSCDGKDASIVELVDELRKPHAPRGEHGVKVNNSTWQNLYLGREDCENRYFHSPIIELAREHGIPVPFNEVALECVEACCRQQSGPNGLRAGDVLERIKKRGVQN
jgi:2-dehydropantoate 2-reductase